MTERRQIENPAAGQTLPVGRHSIRTRLLALAIGAMVVATVILLAAALTSAGSLINTAENTSTNTLRQQVQAYQQQINRTTAAQNALLLDRAAGDVRAVADAAGMTYSQPAGQTAPETAGLTRGSQGQVFNGTDAITSLFIPNTVVSQTLQNPALAIQVDRDIQNTAGLEVMLKAIKDNNPNASAIYLGTTHGVLRYYPNIDIGQVLPPEFDPTHRPWYRAALEKNAGLAEPHPVWTPVYFDATGLGMVTTVAMPVYAAPRPAGADSQGTRPGIRSLVGVIGLDITLAQIESNLRGSLFSPGSYSFLLDDQGKAILLPEQGWQDLLGRPSNPDEPNPDLLGQAASPGVRLILESMQRGGSGFETIQLNGAEYFIAYTPFQAVEAAADQAGENLRGSTGWSLGTVVPAAVVLDRVSALQAGLRRTTQQVIVTRILPLALLVAAVLLAAAWFGTNRLVEPVLQLAQASQKLGARQWEETLPQLRRIENRSDDEFSLLAGTLISMTNQQRQAFDQLEQRVAERTAELERRTLQIETAAQVAQQITSYSGTTGTGTNELDANALERMLTSAVNLISQRFGYYNVGIFLVDETSEHAHLKAASGELGEKLLQQDIRLRVGQQGIVGYVTRFGQARLANDVRTDRAYYAEPLLDGTRSEVALPLRSGDRVIGALDVQSTHPLAFSEDDLQALQTLADQLAIAIENIRLVTRLQAALQETSLLYQQQSRQAWGRLADQSGLKGFEYDLLEVKPLQAPVLSSGSHPGILSGVSIATQLPIGATSKEGGSTMAPDGRTSILQVPVRLRNQVIGYIGLESDEPGHVWSEDEIAIAEATASQAALSVENARLLAESQRRAAHEKLAAEITARMRTSLEMENVLQTAMRELAQRMGIAQVEVHLGSSAGLSPWSERNGDEAD